VQVDIQQLGEATSASTTTRYRLRTSRDGHDGEVCEIEATDDGEALMSCWALLADWREVEAWDGDRLVCRIARPSALAPRL